MASGKLMAWWWSKQGLDGSLMGKTSRDALVRSGWSRSVGGASPYIAIFARTGASRKDIDEAVAHAEIHELPSARGCTHVLPLEDFALGLKVAQGFGDEASVTQAKKYLGVTDGELEKLQAAILRALEKGPLDTKQIKDVIGDAVRHLGGEGKKRGTTTTLSLGLALLQTGGKIRRVPLDGRLDRQCYAYSIWKPSPMDSCQWTREEAFAELARRYFRWIGPASLAHFQWFSGLGVQAAKAAVSPLRLEAAEPGSELLLLPEDVEPFHAYELPEEPTFALIGSIDSHLLLRRNIVSLLDDGDKARKVPTDNKMVVVANLQDLSCNAILDRGRIVGLWEFDPEAREVVAFSFVQKTPELAHAIASTEAFVKEQLGDCRSFSLDSPESRKPKLRMLREMAMNL